MWYRARMIVVAALSFGAMLSGVPRPANADRQHEVAAVQDLLQRKVPQAVDTLRAAVEGFDALGPDLGLVASDTLVRAMARLEDGRLAVNAVDHAFKQGVTIGGKAIVTGLPGLDALAPLDPNVRQLRIMDELMRRGVPPSRIPYGRTLNEWLPIVSPEAVARFSANQPLRVDTEGNTLGGSPTGRPWDELTPAFQAQLDAIAPGQWECGLAHLVARHGLAVPGRPGFGQRCAPGRDDPRS